MLAADPQLGQPETQPTTAVETLVEQWALQPEAAAMAASAAVAAQRLSPDPQAVSGRTVAEGVLSASPAKTAQPALPPSASSRTLKPEYPVSFAEEIRSALELEAQHAKHGMAHTRGRYFQGESYFQETAGTMEKEEEALRDVKEEAALGAVEEEERPHASETVCGAGELWRDPQM